jgi:hypothetical protein
MAPGGELFLRLLAVARARPLNRHIAPLCGELAPLPPALDGPLFSHDTVRAVAVDMASILMNLPPPDRDEVHAALDAYLAEPVGDLLEPGARALPLRQEMCTDAPAARMFGRRPRDAVLLRHWGIVARVETADGRAAERMYMCACSAAHAADDVRALSLLRNPAARMRELCAELAEIAPPEQCARLADSALVAGLAVQLLRELWRARERLRAHGAKK